MTEDEKRSFESNPRFYNHMIHWERWAEHFKSSADKDTRTLALMLESALEEIQRLTRRLGPYQQAHAALLFKFIETVDGLCNACLSRVTPFESEDKVLSVGGAWKSIQQLNEWRSANKLNIREVDIS